MRWQRVKIMLLSKHSPYSVSACGNEERYGYQECEFGDGVRHYE